MGTGEEEALLPHRSVGRDARLRASNQHCKTQGTVHCKEKLKLKVFKIIQSEEECELHWPEYRGPIFLKQPGGLEIE